jgi:fatty acid desaturase
MLLNLAGLSVGGASIATGWPTGHPLWTVAMILWIAYFQHTWMTIFHEDAHYTLYPSKRWRNVMNGSIVGTFLWIPFHVYRETHLRHHSKMNTPEDWELWPYSHPDTSLGFRRMFAVLDILFGIWMGPFIYGRIFFHKDSPLTDPKLRRQIAIEYLVVAVFWSSVIGVVAYWGAWVIFAKVYLIPGFVAGVIQTFRKFTEHMGLPLGNATVGTRTVLSESWFGRLMAYTSFHIFVHGVHHQYPQMPHTNFRKACDAAEFKSSRLVFPSYWRAMLDMFPHLLRPGIGVNAPAGSSDPDQPSLSSA